MLTVACVLRSGSIFNPRWVQRLKRNIARYAPGHRFVCLSDCDVSGVETIPLAHDWPRWWPIIEVFRPGLFEGRVIYFDLADMIVDRIEPLIGEGFIMSPEPFVPGPGKFCSGVMSFDGNDNEIYERFDASVIKRLRGDQDWIAEVRPSARMFRNNLVVSYKVDCKKGEPPDNARVVLFHGIPKPPEVKDPWFRKRWLEDW